MPTVADIPAIATLLMGLFGDFLIYVAAPILIVSIITDLVRDWFRDDSEPLIRERADFGVVPRDFALDSKPSVPTYLSTHAVRERRQGSRKPR